ncbi:MAG TPA: NADH-quinone oxidoreductase subunit C [Bryobacteraceae bacterium]|nr:NADH-quinone oxidoreductase subunit C [Bryobacteraceae bacterium]
MLPESLRENPIAAALADVASDGKFEFGELTIEVEPANIAETLQRVRTVLGFNRLSTITGVDLYPAEPRFAVIYHLQSIATRERLRIKTRVPGDNPELESACSVYPAANWYERETFDFFGVRFLNHPDLKRIMLPEDFEGNPLRKDFPVTGLRY